MRQRLSEYLQAEGKVSGDELAQARRTQKFFGGSLLFNLVRLSVLKEPEAEEILSRWSGYPYAPLRQMRRIPEHVLSLLDPAVASRRRLVPFQVDPGSLGIVTSRMDNEPFIRELERRVGLPVVSHIVMEERLEGLLERHYGIPAPRRDAVRPVEAGDSSLPGMAAAGSEGTAPGDGTALGLDGLPLESDVSPQELLPSRRQGGLSPLAEALGDLPDEPPAQRMGSRGLGSRPSPAQGKPAADTGAKRAKAGRTASPAPPAPPATSPPRPPVEPAVAPPSSASAEEQLARAGDREEIGRAAVELALARGLVRVALFGHQKERLVGWAGGGAGVDAGKIHRLSIPLYTASIFAGFRVNPAPYVGILPDQPANRELLAALGGDPPRLVTAIPILLKDRLAGALYADGGPGSSQPVDLKLLAGLAAKVASALEILLLRKKILS